MVCKKIILISVFLLIFFLAYPAKAVTLDRWNIDIEINDDNSVDWTVDVTYPENISKSDYWIFAKIASAKIYSGDIDLNCLITDKGVGTSIACKDIDKIVTTNNITYKFTTPNQITSFNDFKLFKYEFSMLDLVNNFSVVVRLPLGAALVEKTKLKGMPIAPFEPAFGQEGSDGRRIFIKWEINKPKLGDSVNVSVIFESVNQTLVVVITAVVIVFVAGGIIFYYLRGVRRSAKDILDVLSANERQVMEIVLRDKKIDQRHIVRETEFSKAKVSRIIQNLSARGVIDALPKGRTKIISFKPKKKTSIAEIFSKTKKRFSTSRFTREQAVELIQEFLTPMMDLMEKETNMMQSRNFSWSPDVLKPIKISQKISALHNDMKKIYPTLDEKVRKHNILIEDVNTAITKTIKTILNKKFVIRCEEIIEDHNKATGDNLGFDCIDQIALHILDNKAKIDTSYKHHGLWEKRHKQFLKIRDTKPIKSSLENIERLVEDFEKFIFEFREDLEGIREEFRSNYNILVKEFYKK